MKYAKAKKISRNGKFENLFNKAWDNLPSILIKDCTSFELAKIIDYGQEQKQLGSNEMYNELKDC